MAIFIQNVEEWARAWVSAIRGVVQQVIPAITSLVETAELWFYTDIQDSAVDSILRGYYHDLRQVILKGKNLVDSCKSLATYLSNGQLIQEIKDDLERGSEQKLEGFCTSLIEGGYIATFDRRLEEFQKSYTELEKRLRKSSGQQYRKSSKKQDEVDVSYKSLTVSGAATAFAGIVLVGCAVTISVPFAPIIAPAVTGLSYAGVSFGAAFAATGYYKLQNSAKQTELSKLHEIDKLFVKLQNSLYQTKEKVQVFNQLKKNAVERIVGHGGTHGLMHLAGKEERHEDGKSKHLHIIKQRLDEMETEMKKALKKINEQDWTVPQPAAGLQEEQEEPED